MSLAQYASPYNNESEVDYSKNQKNQGVRKMSPPQSSSSSSLRKTIKRPPQQSQTNSNSRVSNFMNQLNSQSVTTSTYIGDNDNDSPYIDSSEDLTDYTPPPPPSTNNNNNNTRQQVDNKPPNHDNNNDDKPVTKETFMDLPSSYAKQYYQQYQQYSPYPYTTQAALKTTGTTTPSKDELLEKMNHIISMLEEQQDEKTGNVTEELILYCFLGVFVIFVVDSFARAGKYVR
jgi:hypothetical protein